MERELKYVNSEYKERLDNLAELLVTRRRFGQIALEDTVEFPQLVLDLEIPENVLLGQE